MIISSLEALPEHSTQCALFTGWMREECWKQNVMNPSPGSGRNILPADLTGHTGNEKLGFLPRKGPSLLTYLPLSAQFLNPFLFSVWLDLLLDILLLVSILFLKVCSFIQSPNLSCKLDLQPVEIVRLSTSGAQICSRFITNCSGCRGCTKKMVGVKRKVASGTNLILLDLQQACFHCSIACA